MNLKMNYLIVILLFFSMTWVSAQNKKIDGYVYDKESNQTLPGVNVVIKGTTSGTITNIDGYFSIEVPNGTKDLEFSYVGYLTETKSVATVSKIYIYLKADTKKIDEVVVVGYGTQRKADLTGAVAAISAKKIDERPNDNILKSIQGTVPGVMITDDPSGGVSVNIRGRGNLGKSSPLYIVDNVEVTEGFFSSLDPSSIENITFLKDASSAAIYGAKAAYGVVLITTKEGKPGKTKVSYSGAIGFKKPTVLPDMVSSFDYANMYNAAQRNSGIDEDKLKFSPDVIQKYKDGSDPDYYPNTRWVDLLLNDNPIFTRHSVNITSGGKNITNMLGFGYVGSETFSPGEKNNRFNFSDKVKVDINKYIKLTSGITYIHKYYDRDRGSASWYQALRVPSTQVAVQSNGDYGTVRNGKETSAEESTVRNPYRTLQEGGRRHYTTRRLLGTLNLEINPIKHLKITNQFAYKYYSYDNFDFTNTMPELISFITKKPIAGSSVLSNKMILNRDFNQKYSYDGWINYDRSINKVHNFSLLGGVHADSYRSESLKVGRRKFGSNEMGAMNGGSIDPNDQETTTNGVYEESMMSFFGRINYDYKGKYLAQANFRADASSRFAESGRWGYFPSISAGWRLSEEKFMKDIDWLDNLKLRASYGQSGNINNVGLYDSQSTYSESGNVLLGDKVYSVVSEGRISNPNLTWETAITTNVGVDAGLFDGGLNFTIEYYNRLTKDILVHSNDIAAGTGISGNQIPAKNVGEVRNRGIELSVFHHKDLGDFSYTIGANASINKNEITNLGDVKNLPQGSGDYTIMKVGESVGAFNLIKANGIYSTKDTKFIPLGSQKPEPGMIRYVDQNGDGVINNDDRTIVGQSVPNFTYGLNIDLKYKNFGLNITGQGIANKEVYLDLEASQIFFDGSLPRAWQRDNWTPTNQNAIYPRLFVISDSRYTYNGGDNRSSFWLFDASYFRVKNIMASYTIPTEKTNRWGIENLRFYVSADNVFTIRGDKRMKDFEVERGSGRSASFGVKTYTAGMSFSF